MVEITVTQATGAAQALVRQFNSNSMSPPQSHSVWIKTDVDNTGEFVRSICVSEHPKWKGKLKIPAEIGGVPVEQVPWPTGQR